MLVSSKQSFFTSVISPLHLLLNLINCGLIISDVLHWNSQPILPCVIYCLSFTQLFGLSFADKVSKNSELND
jgi:hypothetical protein